jgi:hypothetical protein
MKPGSDFSLMIKSTPTGSSEDMVFNKVCPEFIKVPGLTREKPIVPEKGAVMTE